MKTFKLRALHDWNAVAMGEVIRFEAARGYREITFRVNAPEWVQVWTADEESPVLLGAGDGIFEIEVTVSGPLDVTVVGREDSACFIATDVRPQLVAASDGEAYTTPLPLGARQNDDMKRMLHLMKMNARRRDAIMAEELKRIREALVVAREPEPELVEPEPKPEPEPEPKE